MRDFTDFFRPTFAFLVLLTAIFGFAYPGICTLAIQALFPHEAEGSLIAGKDGSILGSELIGQNFSEPQYFWSRLSATGPYGYNAAASSGSNLSAGNPALLKVVQARIDALKKNDATTKKLPVDLVTASSSGLDPHISPAAAIYQINRVARARGLTDAQVSELVQRYTEDRQFGVLGEPGVNVLKLNLALDGKI